MTTFEEDGGTGACISNTRAALSCMRVLLLVSKGTGVGKVCLFASVDGHPKVVEIFLLPFFKAFLLVA